MTIEEEIRQTIQTGTEGQEIDRLAAYVRAKLRGLGNRIKGQFNYCAELLGEHTAYAYSDQEMRIYNAGLSNAVKILEAAVERAVRKEGE